MHLNFIQIVDTFMRQRMDVLLSYQIVYRIAQSSKQLKTLLQEFCISNFIKRPSPSTYIVMSYVIFNYPKWSEVSMINNKEVESDYI